MIKLIYFCVAEGEGLRMHVMVMFFRDYFLKNVQAEPARRKLYTQHYVLCLWPDSMISNSYTDA